MRKLLVLGLLISGIGWDLASSGPISTHFLASISFASVPATSVAEKTISELKDRVNQTKEELKRQTASQDQKIAAVNKFKTYVSDQLTRQEHLKKRSDPNEDALALELIGFDQDLDTFLDSQKVDLSSERCAGYRAQLIHSYSGTGGENPELPSHTQDVLSFLDLLCKSK